MPREDHNAVEFYTEAVEDGAKSREAGRIVYTEVEMAHVRIVGDRGNDLKIRADEAAFSGGKGGALVAAKDRWPDHYAAFKRHEQHLATGTPLAHLPFLNKAMIAELNFNGIASAEQLAGLSEQAVTKGYNWRDLRTQAQVWLADADKNALAAKAALENDALKQRLADLEAKLSAMDDAEAETRTRRKREAATA